MSVLSWVTLKVFFFLSQVNSDVDINDGHNWAPLLANCGLLFMSCAHCLVTVVSGFRCYRQVCPCARQKDRKQPSASWPLPDSPEPAGSFYSTSSKEMLISNWLGQQQHRQNMLLITQPPVSLSLLVCLTSCKTIPITCVFFIGISLKANSNETTFLSEWK
jgi:hypothetical protein